MMNDIINDLKRNLKNLLNQIQSEEKQLQHATIIHLFYQWHLALKEEYEFLRHKIDENITNILTNKDFANEFKIECLNNVVINFEEQLQIYQNMKKYFEEKFGGGDSHNHINKHFFDTVDNWFNNNVEKISEKISDFKKRAENLGESLQEQKDLENLNVVVKYFKNNYATHQVSDRFLIDRYGDELKEKQSITLDFLDIDTPNWNFGTIELVPTIEKINWEKSELTVNLSIYVGKFHQNVQLKVGGVCARYCFG